MLLISGMLYNSMKINFANWFEAVNMQDARLARKGMQKAWKKQKTSPHSHRQFQKFKPGTFGIEIEFKVEDENNYNREFDEGEFKEEIITALERALRGIGYSYTYSYQDRLNNNLRDAWWEFSQDKVPEYQDISDWEYENEEPEEPEEPDRDDYENDEDFGDDYDQYAAELEEYEYDKEEWENKRDEMEAQIDAYDEDGLKDEFAQQVIDNEEWDEYGLEPTYEGLSPSDEKQEEYIEILRGLGWEADFDGDGKTEWNVHEDGDGIVELTSSILTTKDTGKLIQLFDIISRNEVTGGDTSCHVHIGMPADTDGFDLVAMSTLADEEHLKLDLPDREFGSWAKFNSNLHSEIERRLKGGDYNREDFLEALKGLSRYHGTNIFAFFSYGTVEFRYLSSDVLDQPDMVLSWINYFLILPEIARRKKQIKLQTNVVLTRLPNGGVRVTKESSKFTKQEPGTPEYLRQVRELSPYEKKKQEMQRALIYRNVDRINVLDYLNYYPDRSLQDSFKTIIASGMAPNIPFIKNFLVSKKDPYLNDVKNFKDLAQKYTIGDVLKYGSETGAEMVREKITNIMSKDFDEARRAMEIWKNKKSR